MFLPYGRGRSRATSLSYHQTGPLVPPFFPTVVCAYLMHSSKEMCGSTKRTLALDPQEKALLISPTHGPRSAQHHPRSRAHSAGPSNLMSGQITKSTQSRSLDIASSFPLPSSFAHCPRKGLAQSFLPCYTSRIVYFMLWDSSSHRRCASVCVSVNSSGALTSGSSGIRACYKRKHVSYTKSSLITILTSLVLKVKMIL